MTTGSSDAVVIAVPPAESECSERKGGGGGDEDVEGGGGDWAGEAEKLCRICHLGSGCGAGPEEGSELIQLGCACKGELGSAHRPCAEAWFRIKGNRHCEICGMDAKNISGEEDITFMETWHGRRTLGRGSTFDSSEGSGCWRNQPLCNFLILCLVIAFVLPWFFHVSVL